MLTDLHIENVAVIRKADISFTEGLNVLTGETGAGKSIVIDALSAVLGGRVSRELVRTGAEKALVSARFTAAGTEDWLEENCVEDEDGELLLLRRIGVDGKSTCRVNGAPVTAAQLRELGELLLDIHGQNDSRQLIDESRHREQLDQFGGLEPERRTFTELYDRYKALQAEIDSLRLDEFEKERRAILLREQIRELEAAEIHPGEADELESRRDFMKNAGKLTEALETAYDALYGGADAALDQISLAGDALSRVSAMNADLAAAERDIQEANALLDGAAEVIRDLRSSLDFSPEEYDALENRLSQLRRLFRKYGRDEAGLLEELAGCRSQLDALDDADGHIAALELEAEKLRKKILEAGAELTEKRRAAAAELSRLVVQQLQDLSMGGVRFEAEITPIPGAQGFEHHGCDQVRFLMSANAGQALGRISKIASGGELSRIMLALKNVFSMSDPVETMVFDEIDTGVSGIAAQRVGEKLARLSREKQVLCVTHLPQIAAMADTHFVIEKNTADGETRTGVTPLDFDGRAREIARLHGGDQVTELTLRSAEEQLEAARQFKKNRK